MLGRFAALLVMSVNPQEPTQADCLAGARLERHVRDDAVWVGCVRELMPDGPSLYMFLDGGLIAAGRTEDRVKSGPWIERDERGLVNRVYVKGREGPVRPCPTGSREVTDCVARCCDVSARACVAPDGGLVGPWDEWDVSGRRRNSNLIDPSRRASFEGLQSFRRAPP